MDFTGTSGDDTLTGTSGDDLFKVFQGGNDTVSGLTGSDVFNFAGTLTAADKIDGGGGQDTVQIKGDYSAGILFGATTMVNVETLTVGAGFNYTITTDDATVAAGAVFTLNASALAAPNTVVFNGSNETDGLLHFHGGAGDDTIGMGPNMVADDHFDGGAGHDELIIGGSNELTLKSVTIHNIEEVQLLPTFNGTLTFNSGNVLAGQTIEIDASGLTGSSYYTINANNLPGDVVFDGSPREAKLIGGSGDDTFNMGAVFSRADRLTGGTGNDTLNLNGDYNLVLASGTITGINEITLAGGHSYNLTSNGNVATDQTMTMNATGLTASDTLFLDFSSETLGSVIIDGSAAPATLKGGQQGDAFDFAVTSQGGLTASDTIDGQGGYDRLYLDGDYTGGHALTLTATTVTNVEEFDFNAGHSYSVTTADATLAAGLTLKADASALGAANALTFNGAAETDGQFDIIGGAGNDVLTGGSGDDTFDLSHGGEDTASGGGAPDFNTFILGNTLDAGDRIDGGTGFGEILVSGGLNLTLASNTLADIFDIEMAAGANYSLTTSTGDIAAGYFLTVDASALGAANTLHFDSSAADDGASFDIIGGAGNDVVTAGGGDSSYGDTIDFSAGGEDTGTAVGENAGVGFQMGAALDSGDRLDGGVGGGVVLNGDYTGSHALTLDGTTLKNIASMILVSGHSYKITWNGALPTPADAQFFKIDAHSNGASDALTLDFSNATGKLQIIAGAANDHILVDANAEVTGGLGADTITNLPGNTPIELHYRQVAESTSTGYDTVKHLNFFFAQIGMGATGVPHAIDAAVTAGTLSTASFDTDLATAVGSGQLGAHDAMLFTASAGTLSGHTFLIIDANGTAGYQAGADYVIDVTSYSGTLSTADFF